VRKRGRYPFYVTCAEAGVPTPDVSCDVNGIKANPAMTQKGLSDKTGLTVDGVGKNIVTLQKKKMTSYEMPNAGQLKKYLNADW